MILIITSPFIKRGLRYFSINSPKSSTKALNVSKKEEYYKNLGSAQNEAEVEVDRWNKARPFEDLPGPRPLPVIGNLLRFLPYVGEYHGIPMQDLVNEVFRQKYGDIYIFKGLLGKRDMVFVFNPDDMEKALRNEGAWPRREGGLPSFTYYRTKTRRDVFQGVGGVLTEQGENWFKIRSVINPILMQPRTAQMYVGSMDQVANDLIENMRSFSHQNENNEMPEDFANELNKWALESIAVIALDTRLGVLNPDKNLTERTEGQEYINSILDMFELMYKLDLLPSLWTIFSTPNWRKYVKTLDHITFTNLKYIDKALKKMAKEPEKPEHEQSVLQRLIKVDRRIAIAMVTDMMLAGVDTTGKTLGAVLYFIARYPEKQEILRKEIFDHLPTKESPVTREMLTNSPYLKAVIKESIRIAPIGIGSLRTSVKDMVLSGYRIPKGTDVVFNNMAASHEERHFKNPKEFIPERWLRTTADEFSHKKVHPFVYLPFGFGPRSCAGKRLANLELEVALAKIIRNFKLTWHHPDMTFLARVTYGIKDPLQLKVEENNK